MKDVPDRLRGQRLYAMAVVFTNNWLRSGFLRAISMTLAMIAMLAVERLWRVRLFFLWLMSPRVDDATFRAREGVCDGCEKLQRSNGARYCGACGCPKWRFSELSRKNRRLGHNCPLGKHPGSVVLPPGMGGCSGCGHAKPTPRGVVTGGTGI